MTKKHKSYPAHAANPVVAKQQNSIPPAAHQDSSHPVAQQVVHHQTFKHSGPLPDPASLDRYNQIVPDAAERIIKMAELNAEHIRRIEMLALQAEIDDSNQRHRETRRGQYAGIFSVLTSFSTAIYALSLGHAVVAGTICSVTVGGLVAVFITGRKAQPENGDQAEKTEDGEK